MENVVFHGSDDFGKICAVRRPFAEFWYYDTVLEEIEMGDGVRRWTWATMSTLWCNQKARKPKTKTPKGQADFKWSASKIVKVRSVWLVLPLWSALFSLPLLGLSTLWYGVTAKQNAGAVSASAHVQGSVMSTNGGGRFVGSISGWRSHFLH